MRALLLLLVCLGCACSSEERLPNQWPISREELARGRTSAHPGEQIYHRYCIGCHGADGRGNGGITGADFTAADGPLTQLDQATLIASVRDGKRGERATMPAHAPVLTDAQIEAVVAYVRTRFAPAGAGPAPAAEQTPSGADAAPPTAPSPAGGAAQPQAGEAPTTAAGN